MGILIASLILLIGIILIVSSEDSSFGLKVLGIVLLCGGTLILRDITQISALEAVKAFHRGEVEVRLEKTYSDSTLIKIDTLYYYDGRRI